MNLMGDIICFINVEDNDYMKINKKTILFLLYFILFEFNAIVHRFIKISIYGTDFKILCVFLWILVAIFFCKFRVYKKIDEIGKYILAFLLLVCIEIVLSKYMYGQSWISSFKMGYFYLAFISYFLFDQIIRNYNDYLLFRRAFMGFVIFWSFIGIIIPSYNILFYETLIALPLFLQQFLNEKTYKNLSLLVIIIVCAIFKGDNLSKNLIIGSCMIIEILIHINSKGYGSEQSILDKKRFKKMILVIVLCAVALVSFIKGVVNGLISNDVGLQVRVEAYSYYLNQFSHKPLLGMGLIDPTASAKNKVLVSGVRANGLSQYYLDDIGFIGFVNQFGIAGICLFLYLIKIMNRLTRYNSNNLIVENLLLFVVYIIMNIALLPTNKTVLPMFVIMLVLMKKNKQFCKEMRNIK